ncbi:MAG: PorT family protein [Fimbriimonadaceae bacterium]|nr:PorT family protein [Chitinophagales bacterium]
MKKIATVVLIILNAMLITAQVSTDTTIITKAPVKDESRNTDRNRFIFNIHWDGWLGAPDSLNVGAFSRGVGLHFFYDIPFSKVTDSTAQFSFAPGIGYSCSNYNNKVQFIADSAGIVSIAPFDEAIDPKRNKLVLNYLEIPIEFRLSTKKNERGNRFKFALGFKGAYMFSSHITYVGPESTSNLDEEIKYKQYRIKSLNTIQYGPTFRFGYGNVNLEAYYGLGSIFEEGNGPTGNPLVIGVSFNPF